jgi:hypothetical protein
MTDEYGRPLAEAFSRWLAIRELTIADVQRASRLSPHTITNIRDARGRRPLQSTLEKLAVGIATDKGDKRPGRYHEHIMKEVYGDFLLTAGYGDPSAYSARSLLDLALHYYFRSPAQVRVWTALIDYFHDTDPDLLWALMKPRDPDI